MNVIIESCVPNYPTPKTCVTRHLHSFSHSVTLFELTLTLTIIYYRIYTYMVLSSLLECRLVYDSCQNNQFSRGKIRKCIDSVTMNRYNLNISINSIMLISTYEPTQSTHKNISNDSFKSINQINKVLLTFFGKSLISLTFFENRLLRRPFFSFFGIN